MVTLQELNKRLLLVEKRVKRIYKEMALSPVVHPLEWDLLKDIDKEILKLLINAGMEGMSTTELAQALNLENPKHVGRVFVYERLRFIAKTSEQHKSFPFVISRHRKWLMNLDDFDFRIEKEAGET